MKLFVRTLVLLLVFGCNQKKEIGKMSMDNLNRYQEYIVEVSHGIVSADTEVRVMLKEPMAQWEGGKELDTDLLRVSPKTKGKVVALDGRTIAFVPEGKLEQDTTYEFTLDLEKLIPDVPKELRKFNFGIKTLKQQFNIYTQALQSYSKDYQYLEGQLRSADKLDLETAKKLIGASQNGRAVSIKFDASVPSGTVMQFKIDSIQRLEEDSELVVSWDGKAMGIESMGKNTLKIPGKSNFSILDVTVESGAKQVVLINFSDPLKKGQNFKGLVVLEGEQNPKYDIDGNVLKVYPSKEITGAVSLNIYEGIQSVDGYRLETNRTEQITFEQIRPEVRFLSNGSILPSSNNLKINFETVNLRSVHVSVLRIYENNVLQFLQDNSINGNYNLRTVARPIATKVIDLQGQLSLQTGKWTAHALDLKSLITPEPGAIYRVEFDIKPSYSLYTCETTNFDSDREVGDDYDAESESSNWDGAENYYGNYYYYDYNWNERENPCHTSYYYDKTIGTNILASDIGVTIKRGANKRYFVAVNDIISTDPIAGAKVTFYNYQQQVLGTVITDPEGTSFYDSENLAYFALVENQGQKTYVRLNDGNALSVSKFKVDGAVLQKGMKGFIFGERGVWRPGDRIFLSFMLNDNANTLPEDHPVKLELLDPYNKVVYREIKTDAIHNFYSFELDTDENAPTGNWVARISVGGAVFTKTLKIETIKPNRLKIKTEFAEEVLNGDGPIKGAMEVAWLHGA
ncbi:MAG TPA: MG2 domain-containing protein, partial [Arenibacter sp.]|nr:MG2 domain-containing protein [Arenibacter sp.]